MEAVAKANDPELMSGIPGSFILPYVSLGYLDFSLLYSIADIA
jgi:hypothetical protein